MTVRFAHGRRHLIELIIHESELIGDTVACSGNIELRDLRVLSATEDSSGDPRRDPAVPVCAVASRNELSHILDAVEDGKLAAFVVLTEDGKPVFWSVKNHARARISQ